MKNLNVVRDILQKQAERITIVTETHNGWTRGWLARISLPREDDRFDLHRVFLDADDEALSYAGNGERFYYDLTDGVYEADSVWRSLRTHRVYFRVVDGDIIDVVTSKRTAKAWLVTQAEQTSGSHKPSPEHLVSLN